ncbi:MAG: peptide chain release factor N(5)-glutamine methyltransferase [Peptostreptococcaceae bacterium]|nr:peptide chain release factor N(5)-glutamine methyltransferase [Peptostreptococcaceae bacterium]
MNIKNALEFGIEKLNNISDTPSLDAEILLCNILSKDRIYLHINLIEDLKEEDFCKFKEFIKQRENNKPIAYIINEKEFMGLSFYVDKNVLIPRPDTEILVDRVINEFKNQNDLKIIDIGCGSGAISISLAKYLNAYVYSLDISKQALEIGMKNAIKNDVADNIKFIKSDILNNFNEEEVDIIVSNPPYIELEEYLNLEDNVLLYEPKLALLGEDNGLYFYKEISKNAKKVLKENGYIFFEIGYNQADAVSKILKENDFCDIKIEKDLSKKDRLVWARKI